MADSHSTSSLDLANDEGGAPADVPGNKAIPGNDGHHSPTHSENQMGRSRATGHGSDSHIMIKLRNAEKACKDGRYLRAIGDLHDAVKRQKITGQDEYQILNTKIKIAACRFKANLKQAIVNDLKEAIDECESIKSLFPDALRKEQVTALVLLAMIYHFLGDYHLEVSSYERALEIARQSSTVAAEMEPTLKAYFTQAIANSKEERPSPHVTTVTLEDGDKPEALIEIEKLFVENRGIAQPDSTVGQASAFQSADDSISLDSCFPGEHKKDYVSTMSAQFVNDASDIRSVDPRVPTSEMAFMSAGGTVQHSVEPQAPDDNDSTSFSSMPASQPATPSRPIPRPTPRSIPRQTPQPSPRQRRQPQ